MNNEPKSETPRTLQEQCYGICHAACERIVELETELNAAKAHFEIVAKALAETDASRNELRSKLDEASANNERNARMLTTTLIERDAACRKLAEAEKDRELIDSLPFNYVQIAGYLHTIGWRSTMDAQWVNILKFLRDFRQAIAAAKGGEK